MEGSMFNQTRQNLSTFDNEHEFERMSTDILNSLGFDNVEPMAPLGGADGGIDMKYRDGDTEGVAFVTLRKDIRTKFFEDLEKKNDSSSEISLFCIVDVTPKQKREFSEAALRKNSTLQIYDLERIRSLFDSTLKDLRRRYLGIDDDISSQIRDKITKLMMFRNAYAVNCVDETTIETMLIDKLPQSIFTFLLTFELREVSEVPRIGKKLIHFLEEYDAFRGLAKNNETQLITKIGNIETCRYRASWVIHFKYSVMRYAGMSIEDIQNQGEFLNYGITWESAEKVFYALQEGGSMEQLINPILEKHKEFAVSFSELVVDEMSEP
jgi:hypothetical protein